MIFKIVVKMHVNHLFSKNACLFPKIVPVQPPASPPKFLEGIEIGID